ncbi:unnamed protein product [Rotaria magnacalcarata]|uniref:Uncharacterized protein n=1 Tax=Rotaria magnacalcarata TaxID=392030 RepID=A0A816Y114_9BILA|nr:unnamed protein product [Rotaria magnacalcarata]
MADISIQLLILLDPRNNHICYDEKIDLQIFRRCSNTQECRDHISNQSDRDKHLFLPDFEMELAKRPYPGLSDTFIYLYCHSDSSIDLCKKELKERALNRIFTVDELPYYLYGAGIELLHKLLKKPPEELNERQRHELALMAKQKLIQLDMLFDQYMDEKLSKETVDLR